MYRRTPRSRSAAKASPFRGRLGYLTGAGLLVVVALLLSRPFQPAIVAAQPGPGAAGDPPAVYTDLDQWEQLSSGARAALEARYGPREPKGGPSSAGETDPLAPTSRRGGITAQTLPANPRVNNPAADATAQDTQSETTLVLGSGSNLIAAFNDSGSFTGGAQKFTGFSRSTDGGATWTDGGTLPTNAAGDGGDPVLARDTTTGRTYLSTLNFSGSGLRVFRSDDNAATWRAPVEGAPGYGGSDFLDKEWITVDNFAGTGNGTVYLMFRNFAGGGGGSLPNGMYLTRSTDGGATFGPTGGTSIFAGGGQGAWVVVGPDHSVYAFWFDSSTPRRILMRRSTDLGVTFGATVTAATLNTTGANGSLGNIGGFRSNSFPQVVVNPVSGHLYLVHNDTGSAEPAADRGNIYFHISTDNGATWSAASRVNSDAGTNTQFFPTIAVRPDGAGLAVSWYDRRRDPANTMIEYWGEIATISGAAVTFGPNFRISDPFPAVFGVDPAINTTYMGDYDQMQADNTSYYCIWADNRDNATFSGASRKSANVRSAKFGQAGPGAIIDFASAAISGAGGVPNVIEANDCNTLSVTLTNNGSQAATGVTATLSTSTAGVTIRNATATYADLAPGSNGANLTPFQISTSPAFASRTIALSLAVSYAGGSDTVTFSVPAGSVGLPTTFTSTDVPKPIADVATSTSTIPVSGVTSPIAKVTVSLHLTHTFDADLDIFLVGPDGTAVELSTDNGSSGDNYGTSCAVRTTFDDGAATSITAGTAPFSGTFRPEGLLSAFIGKSGSAVNGTWTLRITDDLSGDAGSLLCWSVMVSATDFGDGGGECRDGLAVTTTITPVAAPGAVDLTITDTAVNYGPAAATAVVMTNAVPAGTTFRSLTAPAGWSCTAPAVGAAGMVRCTIPSFAVGAPVAVPIVVRATTAGVITTVVDITSSTADPDLSDNRATASATVTDIAAAMTATPVPAVAGATLTATATVIGAGRSATSGVTLTLTLPAGTAFTSVTAPAGFSGCTTPAVGATGAVVCSVTTLAAATSLSYKVAMTLDPSLAAGSTLPLTAVAATTAAGADLTTANNTATASVSVTRSANLSLVSTVGKGVTTVIAGDPFTATFTTANAGPSDAQALVLTVVIPTGAAYSTHVAPAGWTCTTPAVGAVGAIRCTTATLATGGSAVLDVTVGTSATLATGTVLSLNGAISSGAGDPVRGNNASQAVVTIVKDPADLSVTITATTLPAPAGGLTDIVYTMTATNGGPRPAAGVAVSLPLAPGTTFQSLVAPAGWGCRPPAVGTNAVVSCTATTMAAGDAATFTITARPLRLAPATATATIRATTSDPVLTNNSATVAVAVCNSAGTCANP